MTTMLDIILISTILLGSFGLMVVLSKMFNIDTNFEIMYVEIDWEKNTISCLNWYGEEIVKDQFSDVLWNHLKQYCRLEIKVNEMPTTIYIWNKDGHLAYNEPIAKYFENKELLKTGQGYDSKSGKRYEWWNYDDTKKKCPTCGSIINKKNSK